MKVFISQPMNGLTDGQILFDRACAIEEVRKTYEEAQIEVIDSYFTDYKPEGKRKAVKYLAKSLELLADADLVVFVKGWRDARGCRLEQMCAREYDIPRLYLVQKEV